MDGDVKLNRISENIKKLRLKNGLKQSEVSSQLKISQPEYSRYENGEREPKADLLIKLAEHYKTTLDELIR